jgi:hypothetical protein
MNWTIGRKFSAGFGAILAILGGVGWMTVHAMRSSAAQMDGIAQGYLPEIRLATAFESEILNARIFFIYHVTIQKSGALASGWEHFEKARGLMPKLADHVAGSPELQPLRKTTTELAASFATYETALRQILETVKNHRNRGPAFDAMLKEWARLGGIMVKTAGELRTVSDAGAVAPPSAASLPGWGAFWEAFF